MKDILTQFCAFVNSYHISHDIAHMIAKLTVTLIKSACNISEKKKRKKEKKFCYVIAKSTVTLI